ncbi:MAG: hypothetical protein NT069_29345, partial [Planctomycetota bacterium]|nr:hypothetical protein [Planctomycetota bacterium]
MNFVNTDDETAGIVVTSPQATANGSPNVFSVQLQTEPIGQVFVTMTPENDQIRINGAPAGTPVTITFDSLNWTLRQLVQVTSVDDGFVEYIHKSSVRFTVETGRKLDGPTVADLSTKEKAVDLGDIGGWLIRTNLPFSTTYVAGAWFKFKLSEMGGPLVFIRTTAAGLSVSSAPRLSLYNLQGVPVSVAGTPQSLALNGLRDGEYLLNVVGDINLPRGFTLSFDGADRQFEKLALAAVPFSIADNDIPTANLVAGPSASEVFSTPSYFAVKLNAPAPAGVGDAGIRVNFELLNSGRATFGTSTSILHDFNLSADFFSPATRKGYVRVAPGDVQANIGIIPVDD